MIPRRTALAALGAVAAAATGRVPALAQAGPLRVGVIPVFDVAPLYAAQQQGYFAAEGVAVEPTIVRGGAAAIPAITGGSLDSAYANAPSVVLALSRGLDLRIILQGVAAGKTPPDPGAIVKRKDDAVASGKDLEGRVVGCNALRDISWMFMVGWIKATGGNPDKVQIVEIPIPATAEAIKQKRLDAAFLPDPFMTVALGDPELAVLGWPMSKVYADGPIAFFVIPGQLATQRPTEVRAFIRGYKRGAAWVNANLGKESLFSLIAGYSGMHIDLVRRTKIPPANADVAPDALQRAAALLTYTGISTGNVDLRGKIFT